jgi:hypothetical protein
MNSVTCKLFSLHIKLTVSITSIWPAATFRLVRFQAVTAASMKTVLWDMAPCSPIEVDRRFRGAYCLHNQGDELIALIIKAVLISETSIYFYETARHHIPERCHLFSDICSRRWLT